MENKNLSLTNNSYGIFDPFFDNIFNFSNLRKDFKDFDRLMKTDIQENEKNYILEIDMPGIRKEDINIEISNGYLSVSTHKDCSKREDKSENYIRRERFVGNIARTFYVGDISEECIKASLNDGVLSVCIPKENCICNKKKIQIM